MTRQITSCLTCRRRKVRCDRRTPVCSICQRGNHICTYQSPSLTRACPDTPSDIRGASGQVVHPTLPHGSSELKHPSSSAVAFTPLSCGGSPVAPSTLPENKVEPSQHSTLLLQAECSRLVPPLHWAYTGEPTKRVDCISSDADSITTAMDDATRDVLLNPNNVAQRSMYSQEKDTTPKRPLPYSAHPPANPSFISTLMGTCSGDEQSLGPYYPHSIFECLYLLDTFLSRVEAVICLFHEPTLRRNFNAHLAQQELYESLAAPPPGQGHDKTSHFEPLLFGIFFSAIYSMDATHVRNMFGVAKTNMLKRFESALVSALDKQSFISSPAIPVLQAFVLFLTCRCRDDEMQQIWALVGLAVRMAQSLGLHQEPTSFSPDAMDAVQVEIRRRLWYQIFYLDVRTAVSQGLPPVITVGSYTTRLPSNVDDDDILPGQPPLPANHDPHKFTAMTIQLVRLHGVTSMQRLLHLLPAETSPQEHKPGVRGPMDGQSAATHEDDMRLLIETTLEKNQMLYLRYCDSRVPLHSLTLDLSNHIKWKFWIYYYYKFPRGQRRSLSPAQKSLIFSQSLNLLESYISMKNDTRLDPYRWMIDGHSGLHAASYVISVLEDTHSNTELDADLFQRGKQLLRKIQELSADPESKIHSLVRQKIDNVMAHTPVEPEYSAVPEADATFYRAMDISSLDDWVNYLNDTI